MAPPVRFGIFGVEHSHVVDIALGLAGAGAQPVFVAGVPNAAATALADRLQIPLTTDVPTDCLARIDVAIAGGAPADRSGLALDAMRSGCDVICPKPAVLDVDTLARVEAVQRATGRSFSIWFSERLNSPSTIAAIDLVRNGAVGRVVHIVGLAPHRLNASSRPDWFFDPSRAGGLIADLMTHQFDQFIALAGGKVRLIDATTANVANHDRPLFRDIATCTVNNDAGVTGHFRADWLSPSTLDAWGDVRLFIQGTKGMIEVRKVVDIGGRPGQDHVFLSNGVRIERWQTEADQVIFFDEYLLDRAHSSLDQNHVFEVCRLAIKAQALADTRERQTKS